MCLAGHTSAPRGTPHSWWPATAAGALAGCTAQHTYRRRALWRRATASASTACPAARQPCSSAHCPPCPGLPQHIDSCRLECSKALLRAGADPNYMNGAGDLTLFWAIDGGELLAAAAAGASCSAWGLCVCWLCLLCPLPPSRHLLPVLPSPNMYPAPPDLPFFLCFLSIHPSTLPACHPPPSLQAWR